MTIIFISIAVSIFLGAVLLWLSGYSIGSSKEVDPTITNKLNFEISRLKSELSAVNFEDRATTEISENIDTSQFSASDIEQRDEEIARLSSDVAKIEGEKEKALMEIDNIKDELESLKVQKPASLPKPETSTGLTADDASFDDLHAEIDLEKVSHQTTREELAQVQKELAQVRKIATARMATSSPTSSDKGGARFKTMAIGMKSPFAESSDSDEILRTALKKTQIEKRKIEAELEQVKKELQLLKVRN